ncbi:MAG: hypothetical protein ACYDER_27935 [Ktedonobacteraceae bacterium]
MSKVKLEDNRVQDEKLTAEATRRPPLPNGEAAAAFVAAGIGCLMMGILTVLESAFGFLQSVLRFYPPAGSITGISTLMVVAWLVSWFILYRLWRSKQVNFTLMFAIALVCILLGIVGIFPPFVHLFA